MAEVVEVTASHDPLGDSYSLQMSRQAVDLHQPERPNHSTLPKNLANALQTRFEKPGDLDTLGQTGDPHRQAVDLLPQDHPNRLASLNELVNTLHTRFRQVGNPDLLLEAVALYRHALDMRPQGHPLRSLSLYNLASALKTRFKQLGDLDSLLETVELHRQALVLCPRDHADHSLTLNNLANALWTEFGQLGDLDRLLEAVKLHRQALDLRPQGHPLRASSLSNLANALRTRFEQLGDLESLTEAVELHRQALGLRPQGHPDRSISLNNLALVLETRFEQFGDLDSLMQAVELHRRALDLHPREHPDRPISLNNLASALETQFEQLGNHDLLAEAAQLHRQALLLRPPGHPDRPSSLANLADVLQKQFDQLGGLDILAEAVKLHRQALILLPDNHPDCSTSLSNLANTLRTRFEQLGDPDSLAESVELHRQALNLRPQGHSLRSSSMNNLGNSLRARFDQLGDPDSLAEAVDLYRGALDLRPQGHPKRSSALNNLANALHTQSEQLGDLDLLAEAVELHRQALYLCPQGHPAQLLSLNNLGLCLRLQFERLGNLDLLDEAVRLHRQALSLCPPGYPERLTSLINLGFTLDTQYQHLHGTSNEPGMQLTTQTRVCDLDEELALYKEGLQSCVERHSMRVNFLFALGKCLLRPGAHFFDFTEGIRNISEALRDVGSLARHSLGLAIDALPMVEAAYQFSTEQTDAGGLGYKHHDHLVLEVYSLIIRLLPRAAGFGLDHTGRLRELSGAERVSRNAAMRAVVAGRDVEALEMLEEGRGVFWSQALRLRATDLDRLPTQDAQELRKLFQTLESGGVRDESLGIVQRERLVEQRRRLSNAAESLIADIRSRPGMSRFLLPPLFSSLMHSLPESGFMVILVASELGHRALVLNRARGVAASLAIVPPEGGFFTEAVRVSLPRDGGPDTEDKNLSRAIGVSGKAKQMPKEPLDQTLAQLWNFIVKPIIDALGLQKMSGFDRPRVWWCVTGQLTFLPIHAAGITEHSTVQSASDYFVSSYIPTISALGRSHADWNPVSCNKLAGILAACTDSPGWTSLASVEREIEVTRGCFERASAQVLLSSSQNTTSQVLREALEGQTAHILHLACHGEQVKNALNSAFILHDGRLSIQDLMSVRLPDAVLAFLSACQTAKGSEDLPDQAVHLAASMLFCGFRSVVGTMWMMHDEDGPNVARWFYEALFARDTLDLDDIAYALDGAIAKLREKRVPASRWAAFIHIGG